jgi:hypothetical protein
MPNFCTIDKPVLPNPNKLSQTELADQDTLKEFENDQN